MRIQAGSKWLCTEGDNEAFGLTCVVLSVQDHPDLNGDGSIEVKYEDGSTGDSKVRRFVGRHEPVSEKAVEPEFDKDDYINSLENLLVYMCKHQKDCDMVLRTLAQKDDNQALYKMPMIQGMENSAGIGQLADMPFQAPSHGFLDVAEQLRRKAR